MLTLCPALDTHSLCKLCKCFDNPVSNSKIVIFSELTRRYLKCDNRIPETLFSHLGPEQVYITMFRRKILFCRRPLLKWSVSGLAVAVGCSHSFLV